MAANTEESQTRLAGPEDQERFPPVGEQAPPVGEQAPDKDRGTPGERRQHSKERMDSSREECDVQNSRAGGAHRLNRQQDRHQQEYSSGRNDAQYNNGSYQQSFEGRGGGRNRGQFPHNQNDQRGQNNYNRDRNNQFYGRRGPAHGGYYSQQGNWSNQNIQSGSYQAQQYSSGNAYQYRGRGRRDDNDEVFVSKTLSYILRHGAERQGFKLMKGGFLYVDEILTRTQKLHGVKVEEIEKIVKNNDKQRFALEKDEDGRLMIRATQGHTMEVDDLQLEEITSADQVTDVVHGTYNSSWEIIKKSGLSRMGRNHVHFAPGEPGESGVISGMRNTSDVLIYIDIKKALEDGLKFYRSANNVILCPGDEKGIIYPCYFSGAVTRHPRHKLDFDNTIDKNTVKHEPLAKAEKYSGKKNDRQINTPVGLAVESDNKKQKKKKRKNKDKEDGGEAEIMEERVDENSKPVAKRQATEEEKEDASVKNDAEVEAEQFGSMFDENCHQEGSEAMCEEDNKQCDINSNEKTVEFDELDLCDKQIKDCQIDHTEESPQFDKTKQDPTLSSTANSASTESSTVTAAADDKEITVISDTEASISAIDSLMRKKPEVLAVCCYGDKLGTEESKILVMSIVTDVCAYVYDTRDGDDLIKDGHVKELFDDTEITKVFNNIKPQSMSLLQAWDILLDSTPVWDLKLVYKKCIETVSNNDKKLIENEKLDPTHWDDITITTTMIDAGLDKDIQLKLLQRGRAMLKLYSCFHKDQMNKFKKEVYDAVKPAEGSELEEKFKRLKEQRKREKERKKKEEKQRTQEEQAKGQKKSGQAQGQKKSHKKKK